MRKKERSLRFNAMRGLSKKYPTLNFPARGSDAKGAPLNGGSLIRMLDFFRAVQFADRCLLAADCPFLCTSPNVSCAFPRSLRIRFSICTRRRERCFLIVAFRYLQVEPSERVPRRSRSTRRKMYRVVRLRR